MATERLDTAGAKPEAQDTEAAPVSILDQALWSRFSENHDLGEFVRIWFALQIRQIGGVAGGVVVMELQPESGFAPVATWPHDGAPDARLTEAVEAALERETGATSGGVAIAQPLVIDDELIGAVGLIFQKPDEGLAARLHTLQWGAGWLLAAMRRDMMRGAARDQAKMSAVLDATGAVLDGDSFSGACLAAVNLLARRLDCSQVALGFMKGRNLVLATLSDVAEIRMNTGYTRTLERAMAEATDQAGSILHPKREGQGFMVDLGHAALARTYDTGELLTVPLFSGEDIVGALHFQKPNDAVFADGEVMVAEAAGAVLGPLLIDKRRLDRIALAVVLDAGKAQLARLLGPRYPGRKIAALMLVGLVVFFSFARGEFRVSAQAEVQGQVIRSVVSPFDGHVFDQFARAGDIVREGEVIAALDERELRIELLRWSTDLARYEGEYDKALAEREAAVARIAAANIEQSRAKAELVRLQLERAQLKAPFDAIIISGDLSQSLGAAVRRGEELFQIAPLESYRVELQIDETDLDEIAIGQSGTLLLSSLPGEPFRLEVTQITPSLESADGRNFALVEARLVGGGKQIRPGMRGVAKVEVEDRKLIVIWAQPIIDWMRLALWRWTP